MDKGPEHFLDFDNQFGGSSELIDYKWNIAQQINLCRIFLSFSPTSNRARIEQLIDVVETFEDILFPYIKRSKFYEERLAQAVKERDDYVKKLTSQQKKTQITIYTKRFIRQKFKLLLEVAARSGFTEVGKAKDSV